MTPTRTVEDLRDVMESRVADLIASPQTAARVIALDGARRRSRRIASAVVLATAAAAVAIPLVIAQDGTGVVGPSGVVPTTPVSWTSELPGLDLPVGEALGVPYLSGGDLVMNGQVVDVPQLEVSSFLTVPDGVVVERRTDPGSLYATSVELIRPDGAVEVIDTGFIAGLISARLEDGAVAVVYGWMADPGDVSGEIRVVELGSIDEIQTFPVEPPMSVDVSFQPDLARGVVLLQEITGQGDGDSTLTLDLATGQTQAPFGLDLNAIGTTPNGAQVRFDVDRQCVVAETASGGEDWSLCTVDDDLMITELSPDGRLLFTAVAAYDAETGEKLAAFPLPGMRNPMTEGPGLAEIFMGWQDDQTIVYGIGVEADNPDLDAPIGSVVPPEQYVGVRCSVADGCERIPHAIDMIGEFAG